LTGWIDPLGLRALRKEILGSMKRLRVRADDQGRDYPKSRTAARYRARYGELARVLELIRRVQRPGIELRPHKALVNADPDRRKKLGL